MSRTYGTAHMVRYTYVRTGIVIIAESIRESQVPDDVMTASLTCRSTTARKYFFQQQGREKITARYLAPTLQQAIGYDT